MITIIRISICSSHPTYIYIHTVASSLTLRESDSTYAYLTRYIIVSETPDKVVHFTSIARACCRYIRVKFQPQLLWLITAIIIDAYALRFITAIIINAFTLRLTTAIIIAAYALRLTTAIITNIYALWLITALIINAYALRLITAKITNAYALWLITALIINAYAVINNC